MKKLASLLLALVMLISCVPAMAEEVETYSITINNETAGHTYEAYQIFTGDLSSNADNDAAAGTAAVLSNVKWGSSVTKYGEEVITDGADATAVADTLTSTSLTSFIEALTLGNPVKTVSEQTDKTYIINGLEPGYYLVKDKDNTVTGNDAYTEFIIEVVENSTVTPKSSVPQVEKKVKDINDSTETELSDWQDSADHDIGDDVPFQLKATLADNVSAYDTYKIIFHDTLSAGLTYKDDFKVMFGETDVTSYFTDTYEGTTLTISCDNVKAFGAGNNAVITVEYTAELNENAVIGSVGNPNEVYLEFSNNPNWTNQGNDGVDNDGDGETDEDDEDNDDDEPTGETPKDKVIVFTYKVIVNKVDNNEVALKGATFELFKKVPVVAEDTEGEGESTDEGATEEPTADYEWVSKGKIEGTELTTFEWTGLDDGDYKLVEVVAPAGYNLVADIEFTISAKHDTESDDPQLTELVAGDLFTGDVSTGALTTDVVNMPGATLPETGGMGTTILYVGGGILVLAAIVLLIVKRRASAE